MYIAAPERALAGSFYFVENGEASFAQIAQAIAGRLGLGELQSWSVEEATEEWEYIYAAYTSARTAGSEPSAPGPSWVGNRGSPDLGPELQKKIVDGVLVSDGTAFQSLRD